MVECHRELYPGRNVFLLYINDLETHVPLIKYVDDSTLFEICTTNEISKIQESIDKAADWTSMNCMEINSKKSKEMIISFTHDVNFKKYVPNIVERGSSVVERRTHNQVSPGSNPPLLPFRRVGIFVLSNDTPVDSAV